MSIKVHTYTKGDNTIKFYSAEWCKHCKNIKPFIEKWVIDNEYTTFPYEGETISKDEYKSLKDHEGNNLKFIPMFVVNGKYIQTSNKDILEPELIK